jgi:hypothetical protein
MRTTAAIDNDVLEHARKLAKASKLSLEEALSLLARRGASAAPVFETRKGFPIVRVHAAPGTLGPETVIDDEEEDDLSRLSGFRGKGKKR